VGRVISGICDFVCLCVYVCVRAVKEKKRLGTHILAGPRHALTLGSKVEGGLRSVLAASVCNVDMTA